MLFFKNKKGKPFAFTELPSAEARGYTGLDKDEYIKLVESNAEPEEVFEDFEGEIPDSMKAEIELIQKHGSIGKVIVHLNAQIAKLKVGDSSGVLTPVGGLLVVDNFQDGASNTPFDLQFRSTSKESQEFVGVLRDMPYAEIPDLKTDNDAEYELVKEASGDAYTYTFTFKLDAYGKLRLRGGTPSPAGMGTGPELYLGS